MTENIRTEPHTSRPETKGLTSQPRLPLSTYYFCLVDPIFLPLKLNVTAISQTVYMKQTAGNDTGTQALKQLSLIKSQAALTIFTAGEIKCFIRPPEDGPSFKKKKTLNL